MPLIRVKQLLVDATLSLADEDLADVKTATFNAEFNNGNSGSAETIDWTVAQKQRVTVDNASLTYTFTAPVGPCNLILKQIQDSTGSRQPTWPSTVLWPGGSPPTFSGASAEDIIAFYFDGTEYYAVASLDFS